MIPKKEEIQKQILIYLIEDETIQQIQNSQLNKNIAKQVEKAEIGGQFIEKKQSFSASITATPTIIGPPLTNLDIITNNPISQYEESCNSVSSLTFANVNKKMSEIIKIDHVLNQKETNLISNDCDVKPIKVINLETIKYSLQLIGFKYNDAYQFCEILKDNFRETITSKQNQGLEDAFGKFKMARAYIYSSQLYKGIIEFAQKNASLKLIQYFDMCVQILQKKYPLIILLGGTSGTGKSTLSSILSSRFQIPTVLSTDSIRHIIRNFMDESEEPLLFTSTYEAGKILKDDTITKESKKTIQGYKIQCKLVQQKLENVIAQYAKKNEPMIIEGVHLTPRFMFSMMKKYPYVIPFTICIEKESKHKQRFAVRSKYMTLDKKKNKYIQYISNIRMIQAWFMEKSDEHLIPKINNVNIDKSVNIIHRIVTTYMRKMINDQMSVIPDKCVNALKLYKSFNKVIKPIINKLQVGQEVNKNLVMQKFLDNFEKEENEMNINNNSINEDIIFNHKNNLKSNKSISIKNNQIVNNYIEIIDSFTPSNELIKNSHNNIKIIINNENSKSNSNIKNNISENDDKCAQSNQNINITNEQLKNVQQLNLLNISIDSNTMNQPTHKSASQQSQKTDINIINKSNSQSIDSISFDLQMKKQNSNNQNINQIINQDNLMMKKEESKNLNLNNKTFQTNQNEFESNFENTDPNVLLNQFLNDLENKHPKSFVEYTIKKIEDIQQTALKEYQQNLPVLNTDDLQQQDHNQIGQEQIQKNLIINNEQKVSNSSHKTISILSNQENYFNSTSEIQNQHQTSNFSNQILNTEQFLKSKDSEQQVNLQFTEQIINKIEIKLNNQTISNDDLQLKHSESQNSSINNNMQSIQQFIGDKKNTLDTIQPIRKKKKLKMDEKSNQVTLHSSQNEEQTNNEIQSEGDSLRMGEDNYQFDVLSEGEEEDEDPNNQEEQSNSIDDEEEADYIDNFENQTDESSDQDEEIKDDQYGNEDDDYDEEEEEDEEEGDQEKLINKDSFKYQIGDIVYELDPEQLKLLNYDDYSNYIKQIEQIVEATLNLQKLKDSQNGILKIDKTQNYLHRKKIHQSKSQLFNYEDEVRTHENNEFRKKTRIRSGKYDRQHSFNKKIEIKTQQIVNPTYQMTQSMNFSKKKQKQNRSSRKNTYSQNLMTMQKSGLSTNNNDNSPIPLEKRTKSCDPQSNLHQINYKKKNISGELSNLEDEVKQQMQNSSIMKYEIQLERVESESIDEKNSNFNSQQKQEFINKK